ncbi:MAG: hypothetical protein A2117_00235 [Candidatus Wildermuthbacteria bacterium GWA2_46_15]|uniref:Heat-inducible transcription repressor HrcA C-terminal domain-containing protein n=1 Tax=Candidatus Wildermuthbacteria bacterium GWA2_46_15 TaxID=1802443 RepID=A0A1G2QNC9_9BACT|nr:MAG: hypothetical protein A2117_00235 [Candidatus Wildermuthbacteria bacterium GWA2_46_15]
MELTERQKLILGRTVEEYIDSANPISSGELSKKHDFGICTAMIRIEMERLEDEGFLFHPFISAGRMPTDKGYRFFVDHLLENKKQNFKFKEEELAKEVRQVKGEVKDYFKTIQELTKIVSEFTSSLALSYLPEKELSLKEGWGEAVKEPEFSDSKSFENFIGLVESWEREVIPELNLSSQIEVFIGQENPSPKAKDFTIIASRCSFPEDKEGILVIFGPKRMTYNKNIWTLNSITKLLLED